jgi:hypothetical protein
MGLMLYVIADLRLTADNIGDAADRDGNTVVESLASRWVAEIDAEFKDDLENDYLKLAQLFDPRVSHRVTESEDKNVVKAEVNRLLELAKVFAKKKPPVQAHTGDSDDSGSEGEGECKGGGFSILLLMMMEEVPLR